MALGRLRCARRSPFLLHVDNLFQLGQKPTVDPGELVDLLDGEASPEGMPGEENPIGVGDAELVGNQLTGECCSIPIHIGAKPARPFRLRPARSGRSRESGGTSGGFP